jgi:HKD family nuclease
VGFFSSSALNFIGDGLLEMARNGGKIYLATSPRLSDDDILAIRSGYIDRETIEKRFLFEVQETLITVPDENVKMLYALVREGIVDVKIVIRNNGMYHDKLALLEDFDGNVVACVGSNNETGSGYGCNYEKTRVYKSWNDIEGRIADETEEFDSIWNNENSQLHVYDFMTAFENELLDRLERRGVYSNTSIKYEMRPYQIEAKEKWNANNHNGFFVMATGTGKTITSLYSIKEFVTDNRIFTVIAVPYKHLVSQWAEDVKEFFRYMITLQDRDALF